MNETQAREEICRVGESLFARGYVHATAGNISMRLDPAQGGGFLITPTDACLGRLDPARLARLDDQGRQISGDKASKTIHLHRQIYQAASRFDVATACVIHTHSTHCVLLSLATQGPELLEPITPYFVMKVGHVPLMPYARPGDPVTAERVATVISHYGRNNRPLRAVMLARLGPTVWHDSPGQAMVVLEELEETAKLSFLSHPAPSPLAESEIEELRQSLGARW